MLLLGAHGSQAGDGADLGAVEGAISAAHAVEDDEGVQWETGRKATWLEHVGRRMSTLTRARTASRARRLVPGAASPASNCKPARISVATAKSRRNISPRRVGKAVASFAHALTSFRAISVFCMYKIHNGSL